MKETQERKRFLIEAKRDGRGWRAVGGLCCQGPASFFITNAASIGRFRIQNPFVTLKAGRLGCSQATSPLTVRLASRHRHLISAPAPTACPFG